MNETMNLSEFMDGIRGGLAAFGVDNLQKVLLVGLGVAVPLALAWFGYRWITRRASKALTKGKM